MTDQCLTLIGDTVYLFGYPVLKLLDGPPPTIMEKVRRLIDATNEDDEESEYQRGYNDGIDDRGCSSYDSGRTAGYEDGFSEGYDEGYDDAKQGKAKRH